MKHRYLSVFILLCLIVSFQDLFAFGSREKEGQGAADGPQIEESRSISLILVSSHSGDKQGPEDSLATEASLFLFQEYSVSDTAVKISSDRRFSMPVKSRRKIELSGIPLAVEYRINLAPTVPQSYHTLKELEVDFPANELLSSGRVSLQPGRRALLEAAGESGLSSGSIRIKSMTYNRKGEIIVRVEIARRSK